MQKKKKEKYKSIKKHNTYNLTANKLIIEKKNTKVIKNKNNERKST